MGKQLKKTQKPGDKKKDTKKSPLIEARPRNFQIGNAVQPKRDLTRFVKWPKYILLQRQKRVLLQRLKVPPALNHFRRTVESNQAKNLFRILSKYKPETSQEKAARLKNAAASKEKGKEPNAGPKPVTIKFGLNHVTHLVENGKAKLVVIAADVDPIEMVVWLPALCRKKDVTYCIVKSKAKLGELVHQKTATCVALKDVRKDDHSDFDTLCKSLRAEYNDSTHLKQWSDAKLGAKSQHKEDRKKKAIEKETLSKQGKH
jgi:large subunit ribosomal protein L7Ae